MRRLVDSGRGQDISYEEIVTEFVAIDRTVKCPYYC